MKTYETAEGHCPACGAPNDRASSFDDSRAPIEGDFSLCIQCGEISRFNADGTLRKMVTRELDELETAERIALVTAQRRVRVRRVVDLLHGAN